MTQKYFNVLEQTCVPFWLYFLYTTLLQFYCVQYKSIDTSVQQKDISRDVLCVDTYKLLLLYVLSVLQTEDNSSSIYVFRIAQSKKYLVLVAQWYWICFTVHISKVRVQSMVIFQSAQTCFLKNRLVCKRFLEIILKGVTLFTYVFYVYLAIFQFTFIFPKNPFNSLHRKIDCEIFEIFENLKF